MGDLGSSTGKRDASGFGFSGFTACLLAFAASCWCQPPPTAVQPFDWDQRWHDYIRRTYSWPRLTFLAADAGLEHALGEPGRWNREPRYFGYRFATGLGRRLVSNSIELGVGAALDEDTRLRPSRRRGFGARLWYAAAGSATAYRDERRVMAYSRLAATLGGALAVALWDPRPSTTGRFFTRVGFDYIGHLQNSLLLEFAPDLRAAGRRIRHRILRR